MGGNTLGHKSLKEKSLKNEEIEEEEIGVSLRFVYSLFPPLFSFLSFDGCSFFKYVLVCFLRSRM